MRSSDRPDAVSPFHEGIVQARVGEIDWASNYFDGPEDPSYILLHMEPKAFHHRKPGEYDIVQIEVS